MTTGTYSGFAYWNNESSVGNTPFLDNISVVVDNAGLATITFPAGTVIGQLYVPQGYSYLQLTKTDQPGAGGEFKFEVTEGNFEECACTYPIRLTNESLSKSSCSVTFSAFGSNASHMKYMYLQRSLESDGQFINVAKQDISFINNSSGAQLSLTDNYPKRNSNGNAYYRLRFEDIDGRITYSSTKTAYQVCQSPSNGTSDCSSTQLQAPISLCSNVSLGVVRLVNAPMYSDVQWSYTPADNTIARLNVVEFDKVHVRKSGAGNFTVSAYIPGCNLTLTRNIQVTEIPLAKLTNTSNNQSSTLSLNTSVTAGNYRIDLNCPTCTNVTWTGSRPLSPTNGNQTNFSLVSGSHWVRATGNNACGPFTRTYNFYVRSGYGFTVTPNPSGGLTTLAADQGTTIKEVRVFDQIGREYFKKAYPNGVERAQIDLSSLKGGFYLIQINNGQESKVQQLVIKK